MRALGPLVIATVLGTGCGRWGFDAERRGPDAGDDPDATADASDLCDPLAPFGPPVAITELDDPTVDDGTLRLTPDELSGYFWSRRSGLNRIYYASRTDRHLPFTFTIVSGLNTTGSDLDPTLSPDGTLLVFRHNTPGDDIWMATVVSPDTFTNPVAVASLNMGTSETQPFLQPGGNVLLFQSNRTGNGDIYRSIRTGTTFSAPTLVTELATPAEEGDPVLTEDGLTILFRSQRATGGLGKFDIYIATRPTTSDPFGTPALLPNVNSVDDDGPSWLSPDGCRLYISSYRATGLHNDIYVATRGT